MRWKSMRWTLVAVLLAMIAMPGRAQIATTQIADTIHRADGTTASGTLIISWPTFTTATSETVQSGSTSASISSSGVLSFKLIPNAGATPVGSYYTAIYHLDDGSVTREYWVVPASSAPVTISAIRNTVLPASVALQTVSKSYVDTSIAAALAGHPVDGSTPYITKSGDAMLGPLALSGDPTTASQAATKHYVDTTVTSVASGLSQKLTGAPSATQVVNQPTGTQLQTNLLNGVEYASQYVSGRGNNGVANAIASPDCAPGCEVKVEQTYGSSEGYTPEQWNSSEHTGTHVADSRGAEQHDSYFNPLNFLQSGHDAGQVIDVASTRSVQTVLQQTHSGLPYSMGLEINHRGLAGGSNLYPANIESPVPYFKSTYNALSLNGTYNTFGQHVLASNVINCYAVGDCLIGSQFITSSGGFRDEADEGAHPFDLQIREDPAVFQGICSSGCTPRSTVVSIAATAGPGTQGEGRYLIDKAPSKVISSGYLVGGAIAGAGAPGPTATFSGTSFPTSTFLSTAGTIRSQPGDVAPGKVVVAIATSGLLSGFASSTSAIPGPSGVACINDLPNAFNPTNHEMVNYTVIDDTHLQMTFNKAHAARATIAIGGLCGYGIEQTVDTAQGIRQVFPVIGSYSSNGLWYAGGLTPIIGVSNLTSSFLNLGASVATAVRANNIVTLTLASNLPVDANGLTMTISGIADPSYNGAFPVTTTGPNTLTYNRAGADGTSTGGSVAVLTGGYNLYPMAEVVSVFNASTKSIDGQITLAPNTVQWAANDPIEQPHYFQQSVAADTEFIGQVAPRPTTNTRAGIQYESNVGPGLLGWSITNAVPASNYFGNGGTHTVPDASLEVRGPWKKTLDAQAGDSAVFSIRCNSHGCGRWNSTYNLFELESVAGGDSVQYQPGGSVLTMNMRGTPYSFSQQAFTANNVNAATVNAGALVANSVNVTSNASGPQTVAVLAPNLSTGNQICQVFGKTQGPHTSTFFCWWNTDIPYGSLETWAGGDPLQLKGSSLWLNGGPVAIGNSSTIGSPLPALLNVGSNAQFQVDGIGNMKAANFAGILSGTTGAIGGTALGAGACSAGNVGVPGATTGAPVAVSASDGGLPAGMTILSAAVTSPNTVSVQVCAVSSVTPPAKTYKVRVLQ